MHRAGDTAIEQCDERVTCTLRTRPGSGFCFRLRRSWRRRSQGRSHALRDQARPEALRLCSAGTLGKGGRPLRRGRRRGSTLWWLRFQPPGPRHGRMGNPRLARGDAHGKGSAVAAPGCTDGRRARDESPPRFPWSASRRTAGCGLSAPRPGRCAPRARSRRSHLRRYGCRPRDPGGRSRTAPASTGCARRSRWRSRCPAPPGR